MFRPTSLDAFVFGFLAPLHKAHLPSGQLQQHLKQLPSLAHFCDNIISTYFIQDGLGKKMHSLLVGHVMVRKQMHSLLVAHVMVRKQMFALLKHLPVTLH